jgi:hypothetical protein
MEARFGGANSFTGISVTPLNIIFITLETIRRNGIRTPESMTAAAVVRIEQFALERDGEAIQYVLLSEILRK